MVWGMCRFELAAASLDVLSFMPIIRFAARPPRAAQPPQGGCFVDIAEAKYVHFGVYDINDIVIIYL